VVVALGGEERAVQERAHARVGEEVAPDPGVGGDRLRQRADRVGVVEVALPDEGVGRARHELVEGRAELRRTGADGQAHRRARAGARQDAEAAHRAHHVAPAAPQPRAPVDAPPRRQRADVGEQRVEGPGDADLAAGGCA